MKPTPAENPGQGPDFTKPPRPEDSYISSSPRKEINKWPPTRVQLLQAFFIIFGVIVMTMITAMAIVSASIPFQGVLLILVGLASIVLSTYLVKNLF